MLTQAAAHDTLHPDYVARRYVFVSCLASPRSEPLRRNAVDFGLPLIVDSNLAELWVNTVAAKIPTGIFKPRREGVVPSDVRSWREW